MTRYADPASSAQTARRHFFRHFHEIKELQRNPIAAPYFAAHPPYAALVELHRAVHDLVRKYEAEAAWRAPGDPRRRRLMLFRAYVLEQRDPQELMAELGLSPRQFYRDYAIIRDEIADALT